MLFVLVMFVLVSEYVFDMWLLFIKKDNLEKSYDQ